MNLALITSIPNVVSILNKYKIDTPLRMAHFFAQLAHESNFKPVSENLNYSASRLLEIFPKYFNSTTANQYARKPQAIANRVYANRMGNGNELSDDGWRYRGRGFIQLTGKSNYMAYERASNNKVVSNPDLLLSPSVALDSACWFWQSRNINRFADQDNITEVTKLVNGGTNGLADRIYKLAQLKKLDLANLLLGQKKNIIGLSTIILVSVSTYFIYKYYKKSKL